MPIPYLADQYEERRVSDKEFLYLLKQFTKGQVKIRSILSLPLWDAVLGANPSSLGIATGTFRNFMYT